MEKNGRTSQKTCTPKAIMVLLLFIILGIASIIVIVILTIKKENYYDSYYVSDLKEEREDGTNRTLKYRIVDVNKEHYICELKENVKRTHVRYFNRYGIEIAADLYTSTNLDKNKQNKAIVIGPPYGGVKEQGPSVYANELASRGFVVLAFDPSFNGESGGRARKVSSSDIFMEDFSAGVDYLGSLSYVDRENIGGIGICGSGGFLLGAAVIDVRIKAVASIVMYDIPGLNNNIDNITEWNNTIMSLKEARWEDVNKGKSEAPIIYEPNREYENGHYPSYPNEEFDKIWRVFYSTKRGHHPRSTGGFTSTSMFSIGYIPVTTNIEKISPRPILFITGDIAHSFNYTNEAFYNAEYPKKMIIVEGASHIDLYDNVTLIPFDEIENLFNGNLDEKYYNKTT